MIRVGALGVVFRVSVVAGSAGCAARDSAPVVRNVGGPPSDASALAAHAEDTLAASVALDYARPLRGRPRDLAPVIAAYLAACRAGDARSCRRTMALEQQAGAASGDGLRALIERCRAGELDSCRALPARPADDPALAGWAGRAATCADTGCDEPLRRECTAGFATSCRVLAGHDVADDDALFARARALARTGCRADIGPDCELLGLLRETDDDALLRDRYHCELLATDCTRYGLDLRAHAVAARDVFERACQYDHAHALTACQVLVEVYQAQHLPEPTPGRARALRDWLCVQPDPPHDFCARPVTVPAALAR